MNCKNVEPFLSLYVGRDLEEEHSRLVEVHLQACTNCALVADEYAGARQLLQGSGPPFFRDEIYAGIREQVLNEIERESHVLVRPGIFSQLFLMLVQPRMRWITAALLLAISVTVLYLSRKPLRQPPNEQQAAVRTSEPSQGSDVQPENSNASAGSPSLSRKRQVRMAATRRPITSKRETNDRVVQRAVGVPQLSPGPAPLRVEMQTSDRNIRIIWLSGQRAAGARDGSKGT